MKTIEIEIRQQNESHQLFNLYVGYDGKAMMLHSMAMTYEEAENLGFRIIKDNPNRIPKITIDRY